MALSAVPTGAWAQCGVGNNYTGECVRLEWQPPLQEVYVGEIVHLDLYATSTNAFQQPIQGVNAILDWDPNVLELLGNKVCSSGVNEGEVCVGHDDCLPLSRVCLGGSNDGLPCSGGWDDCPPIGVGACVPAHQCLDVCSAGAQDDPCYVCPASPPDIPVSCNWAFSNFSYDEHTDGLNADCGPDTFCPVYTGRPFNDGVAIYNAIKQPFCGDLSNPPCSAPPGGLLVTTLRFRAIGGGTSEVTLLDEAPCGSTDLVCYYAYDGVAPTSTPIPCASDEACGLQRCSEPSVPPPPSGSPYALCSESMPCQQGTCMSSGRHCYGDPSDAPCLSDADCPGGFCPISCTGCLPDNCCTTDETCTSCSFQDTRVVGGTSVGIAVTAPSGPPAQVIVSDCQAPTAEAAGPRYLAVTPFPGSQNVAIRVTALDPSDSCGPSYVGFIGTNRGILAANADYGLPADWGTVSVRGADLLSDRTYIIQADCDAANPGTSLSEPVQVTLWRWGDADNNNVPEILDIVRAIDWFRGAPYSTTTCASDAECSGVGPSYHCDLAEGRCLAITLENVDLRGPFGCTPDTEVDIIDIVAFVDAFRMVPDACEVGPCSP